jgi:hypothetical protein
VVKLRSTKYSKIRNLIRIFYFKSQDLSKKIRILKRKLLKTAGSFQILVGTSKEFENM